MRRLSRMSVNGSCFRKLYAAKWVCSLLVYMHAIQFISRLMHCDEHMIALNRETIENIINTPPDLLIPNS